MIIKIVSNSISISTKSQNKTRNVTLYWVFDDN